MKTKSFIVCIVLRSILSNGIAFAFGEGVFMKEIKLTRGFVTQVDDEDYEWLNNRKWHAHTVKKNSSSYTKAQRRESGKVVIMSRYILSVHDPKVIVDHIDRNPLNNQKSNLRICSYRQNNMNGRGWNKLGIKGVSFDARFNRYRAQITVDRKKIHLGSFSSKEDAAVAYNKAAIKYFGVFANLNKI